MNQFLASTTSFILVLGAIQFSISTAVASNTLNVLPPGGNPYGVPYPEHIQNFWKWMLAIPADPANNIHPFADPTGEKCSIHQTNTNSSVFYLAPFKGTVERTCTVPVGKALLIPVMIVEISDKENPDSSVEQLTTAAKEDQDHVNSLSLKIDNTQYTQDDLLKYRTLTKPFEVTFGDPGLFGVLGGGNSTAVADGYYIITEPLSKGNHTIQFKSSLDPSWDRFTMDVTYNIVAQ